MTDKIPAKLLKFDELAVVPIAQVAEIALPSRRKPETDTKHVPPAARRFLDKFLKHKKEAALPTKKLAVTEVTFNAALWMRVFSQANAVVSFFIVYKDESGEFAVLVDEARIHDGVPSVMLTSHVTVQFKGRVDYIKACSSGLPKNHYLVDELFVQRVSPASASDRQTA